MYIHVGGAYARRAMPRHTTLLLAAASSVVLGVAVAGAAVAPPPNDDRANATPVGTTPATLSGTTVGATDDQRDPFSYCGHVDSTVWYRYSAGSADRLVLRLTALGQLDAIASVYLSVRSRLTEVACAPTDAKGQGALTFKATPGATYLIMVGRQRSSDDGRFRFTLFAQEPTSRPPGRPLPRAGVSSWVDPITNFDDAWSLAMQPGTEYRIDLAPAHGRCETLSLFRPHTRSFRDAQPIDVLPCGGYLTYTPGAGAGGRYALLVTATDRRPGRQRYRLQAAPAGPDDAAPGLPLANLQTRRGTLSPSHADVVDLYRFRVAERSDVTLRLRGPETFLLLLLAENGHRISASAGAGALTVRLGPGHYFVAVRAGSGRGGAYSVSLLERSITTTSVLANGSRSTTVPPGGSVALEVVVGFSPGGAVRLEVDRFDPLTGWHFYRLYRLRLGADGRARVSWRPPAIGHWRARASFAGTRTASPSESGTALVVVSD